jgi:hypothetical protein
LDIHNTLRDDGYLSEPQNRTQSFTQAWMCFISRPTSDMIFFISACEVGTKFFCGSTLSLMNLQNKNKNRGDKIVTYNQIQNIYEIHVYIPLYNLKFWDNNLIWFDCWCQNGKVAYEIRYKQIRIWMAEEVGTWVTWWHWYQGTAMV